MGIVSALGRIVQSPDGRFIGEAIQTDAAINPGNSGGPMIDLQGRVIGVNSQILSPSGASSGIAFAISSATVRRVVPQLIANGRYAHPYLGIGGLPVGGDIITAVNGQSVGSLSELTAYLESRTNVGDTVTVTVNRGGRSVNVSVRLTERLTVQQQ